MTKTKHGKRAKSAAIELPEEVLDRAAGGSGETVVGIDFRPSTGFWLPGTYQSVVSGRS